MALPLEAAHPHEAHSNRKSPRTGANSRSESSRLRVLLVGLERGSDHRSGRRTGVSRPLVVRPRRHHQLAHLEILEEFVLWIAPNARRPLAHGINLRRRFRAWPLKLGILPTTICFWLRDCPLECQLEGVGYSGAPGQEVLSANVHRHTCLQGTQTPARANAQARPNRESQVRPSEKRCWTGLKRKGPTACARSLPGQATYVRRGNC